jgi:HlyD family secretion protein
MMRRWLWFLVLFAVLAGGVLWFRGRGPRPLVVDLASPERRAVLESFVTASGEVVAASYADIGASAMGRIVELPVQEGQVVAVGDLLARLDSVPAASDASAAAAQLSALEAEVGVVEARAAEARQTLDRATTLHAQALSSQADLDAARAANDSALATVEAARRRVAQARAQLARARDAAGKTAITSPLAGVVTRLSVRAGEMVVMGVQNQPGTILMTVSDLSAIDVEVKAAEADVPRLQGGQRAWATLDALPGAELPGQVIAIGASALPVAGTAAAAREFKVTIRLDQRDERLRPGLTADVRILAEEARDVLTVPLQAVVLRTGDDRKERTGVFVVTADKARFVPVTTGIIGGLDMAVDGLDGTARVIAGPFQVLRDLVDGTPVRDRVAGDRVAGDRVAGDRASKG